MPDTSYRGSHTPDGEPERTKREHGAATPVGLVVLLFEDSADDEFMATRAINSVGLPIEITVARDGDQAWKLIHQGDTGDRPPDLIISDFKMPLINGDELLRLARQRVDLATVPFVIFSSSELDTLCSNCMKLGATAYAVKPIDSSKYAECIRSIVTRYLGSP